MRQQLIRNFLCVPQSLRQLDGAREPAGGLPLADISADLLKIFWRSRDLALTEGARDAQDETLLLSELAGLEPGEELFVGISRVGGVAPYIV